MFAAQYYNIYRANHRIEQIHLTEAEVGCSCTVVPSLVHAGALESRGLVQHIVTAFGGSTVHGVEQSALSAVQSDSVYHVLRPCRP